MAASKYAKEFQAIQAILEALDPLEDEGRKFALRTVAERLNVDLRISKGASGSNGGGNSGGGDNGGPNEPGAGADNPKKFLKNKKPQSDVERVAVLGYLLKHRNVLAFKTSDLTKMNTEAAGRTLSNASVAADNALKAGYFAKAGKGQKQISAFGEEVVEALPDRDAVSKVQADSKPRRRSKKKPAKAK